MNLLLSAPKLHSLQHEPAGKQAGSYWNCFVLAKLEGFLSFSCLFFFFLFNRSGLCFTLALPIKAVASENSWPALIFSSTAALRSQHHPPCWWWPQDVPGAGWWQGQAGTLLLSPCHQPGPPALPQGTPGWFCYVNGGDTAGCLFPHLPPRFLSTHRVSSPRTDSNLTWKKTPLNFVLTLESEFLT